MAQPPPKKRKKRRIQLREAQRRRRARLKEESKSFLQIILSQETLVALRHYSDLVGKPLHACAAELIRRGLDRQQYENPQPEEQQHASVLEALPPHNGECTENTQAESTTGG
jgi:predicted HTH domain antitoxin